MNQKFAIKGSHAIVDPFLILFPVLLGCLHTALLTDLLVLVVRKRFVIVRRGTISESFHRESLAFSEFQITFSQVVFMHVLLPIESLHELFSSGLQFVIYFLL